LEVNYIGYGELWFVEVLHLGIFQGGKGKGCWQSKNGREWELGVGKALVKWMLCTLLVLARASTMKCDLPTKVGSSMILCKTAQIHLLYNLRKTLLRDRKIILAARNSISQPSFHKAI
jgi:hypothetical protein